MESHLDLRPPEKIIKNRLVTGSREPNQISEIEGEEDLLDRGYF
jgi:hypothetical protein